mmetsp:Transcript_15804/g.13436  ORF Transcript_15804/g.13436 Transcript_15804/m.13436 type:complete len:98 (-) Transcript_15804:411-704(-)
MHGREILCLHFDFIEGPEGGAFIYSAGTTGCVYIHKLSHQKEPDFVAVLDDEKDGHLDAISCMTMERNILFTGADDNKIKMWDIFSKSLISTIEQHE